MQTQDILIVIDMQNDFIDGSLGTKEARAIVPAVTAEIGRDYDRVLYTQDTHESDYPQTVEGRKLPILHCQRGSRGWAVEPGIQAALDSRSAKGFTKPTFGSLDLASELVRLNDDAPIASLTFVGLCTDICVISNVLMAKANLPNVQIRVIADQCAGVSPESHDTALKAMTACHIEIV